MWLHLQTDESVGSVISRLTTGMIACYYGKYVTLITLRIDLNSSLIACKVSQHTSKSIFQCNTFLFKINYKC